MTASAQRKPASSAPQMAPEKPQREASDPGASVWVGASAGSGKTTVLTNRVMRLLLEEVPPQKILCLTFTRAAAAEMETRVTDKLSFWAVCGEDELRQSLDELQDKKPTPQQLKTARRLFARVLSCPGGMRIRTIHAFCQEILGRFPVEAGLPPHFAIVEEGDAAALMEEVQAETLTELAEAPEGPLGKALARLVNDLGEHGFVPAMHDVLRERARLEKALASSGGIDRFIEQIRSFLALAPEDTEQSIIRMAVDFSAIPATDMRDVASWLREASAMFANRTKPLLEWLELPAEKRVAAFEDYWRCFLNADKEIFAKFADKKTLQQHPEIDAIMGREALRLQGVLERVEAARFGETTEAVIRLGLELARRYQARKAARAALDYDDLISRADELLHRPGIAPWILYKLDGGLDHILVDEAQDTNRAQWNIIKALADEFFSGKSAREDVRRTLFSVGDEKQSIFSFQKAEPEAFAEMREYFAQKLEESGGALRPVDLHVSFRSAPAILEAVDAVFAMPRAHQGVASEPVQHFAARPRKGEAEKSGRVEVWPLCPAPEKEKEGDGSWTLPFGYEEEHDPQATLAEAIATKISELWNKEILPGTNRPVQPGDIMILLRNRGRFANLMVRALKKQRVPVTGVDRMILTEQLAVMDMLALAQFALLPEDDLNLATVLRGPLLNCSEEQLMQLAIGRKGSLWESLRGNSAFAAMEAYLVRWLNEADFITPFAFLARMLNEPCPGSAISGRRALWARLGHDALDPIEELLNAAQNFSASHAPSMQNFLHQVMAAESEIKREMDRGGGQVRIMTVHGAKGLEAPIVFLPDTTAVPMVQKVPKLLWSRDGEMLYLPRKPKTGAAAALWSAAREKQMEEYRRLLYVALTRAAKRLYIGGWQVDKTVNPECWYGLVTDALKPMHQPEAMLPEEPQPDIAFADPAPETPEEIAKPESPAPAVELPAWARTPAAEEPGLFKTVAPSHLAAPSAATPDSAFARGRIIHRLLQSLPDMEDDKREAVAARFLANPQHRLTPERQEEIRKEVLHLLHHPDYAALFGPGSRAEVPLTGPLGDTVIAGQVDRLCLRDDEVWVVDYKTNRPPPETVEATPEAYLRQMAAYRTVLREIYPGKTVRCFLLWTWKPDLMELPDRLLT